jgi:small conductance mechanosensitive channel
MNVAFTLDWAMLNQWFAENQMLIRIAFIVLGALIARAVFRSATSRIIARVVDGVTVPTDGTAPKQRTSTVNAQARIVQRTRTLGAVLGTLTNWVLGVVAAVLVLSELGFEVTAIVAGAGILGAGLALGAQDIVRDFLNGVFMVFEDQIGIGDKVDVGDAKGVVEEVTIRITKIRDAQGTLWFVRNGQIQRVASKSHPKR